MTTQCTQSDLSLDTESTTQSPKHKHSLCLAVLNPGQFQQLGDTPPEVEWFANIINPRTRKAYRSDVADFMTFCGIRTGIDLRSVTRAHVIAWRKSMETRRLSPATIRRRLGALSTLFNNMCESDMNLNNPVLGVKRPRRESPQGKTPAISKEQARALLDAPPGDTLKGKRDRAILSVFLYHGLRLQELCGLQVGDLQQRSGVTHLVVHGKGGKVRFVPAHPATLDRISQYLEAAGHGHDRDGVLFRPIKNPLTGVIEKPLAPSSIYHRVVKHYARKAGVEVHGFCVHSLRTTAATNALENSADIAKVQDWLGHADISTTRLYDRRRARPEDSPTFRVAY